MRKAISAVLPRAASVAVTDLALLAALLAVGVLVCIAPAGAAEPARATFDTRDQLIYDFCNDDPGASACNEWQQSRDGWSNDRYQSFYRAHRYEIGLDTAAAAAAFAPTGSAVPSQDVGGRTLESAVPPEAIRNGESQARDKHVGACQAIHPSYNLRTDSFTAEDGSQQKCAL